jgi:hypothetical protein
MRACSVTIVLLAASLLLGCGASPHAAPSAHGSSGEPVEPVFLGATIAGRSLVAWDVAWWQWRAALSNHAHAPEEDACISKGQQGPVWFLDDYLPARDVGPHRRSCSISARDYLLFTVPAVTCTTVSPVRERHASNRDLIRCAQAEWGYFRASARLTLDGKALHIFGELIATPAFPIHTPGRDTIFGGTALRLGRAAVDGDAIAFKPLSPGRHVLISEVHYRKQPVDRVTYFLNVS